MTTPTSYAATLVNLSLGQFPDLEEGPVKSALDDVHSSFNNLSSYIAQTQAIRVVTEDYTITSQDNMIIVDATAGNVTITTPPSGECRGLQFTVTRIDAAVGNTVNVVGDLGSPILGFVGGLVLASHDAVTFRSANGVLTPELAGFILISYVKNSIL